MTKSIPFIKKELANLTAVLFSVSQQAFHIEPLRDYVEENIKCSMIKGKDDYRLIAICDTDTEADIYIKEFRYYLEQHETQKQ